MIDKLIEKIEALINERGSATVLREHIGLLRAQYAALERERDDLQARLDQASLERDHAQDQLRRVTNDNPNGHRCDACGSVDLVCIGTEPHPIFSDVGMKNARMRCRVCQHTSLHEIPLP